MLKEKIGEQPFHDMKLRTLMVEDKTEVTKNHWTHFNIKWGPIPRVNLSHATQKKKTTTSSLLMLASNIFQSLNFTIICMFSSLLKSSILKKKHLTINYYRIPN